MPEELDERDVVVLTDTDPAADGPLRQRAPPARLRPGADRPRRQRGAAPPAAHHGARAHQPDRPHALAPAGDRLAAAVTRPRALERRALRPHHSNSRITSSTARLSPGAGADLRHPRPPLGAEHVLHLHRLDHGERLAVEDLVALGHVDAHHQPRHRAEQELRGVGRRLRRHQRRELGLPRRQHAPPPDPPRGSGSAAAAGDPAAPSATSGSPSTSARARRLRPACQSEHDAHPRRRPRSRPCCAVRVASSVTGQRRAVEQHHPVARRACARGCSIAPKICAARVSRTDVHAPRSAASRRSVVCRQRRRPRSPRDTPRR